MPRMISEQSEGHMNIWFWRNERQNWQNVSLHASNDFNSIKHVSDRLGRQIWGCQHPQQTIQKLQVALRDESLRLQNDVTQHLTSSIRAHGPESIHIEGGQTFYRHSCHTLKNFFVVIVHTYVTFEMYPQLL